MSGALRWRRKQQRRMARLAVFHLNSLLEEINERSLELHRIAVRHASVLRTRNGRRAPLSSEASERARSLERDIAAVVELLDHVFVKRSQKPECLGFTQSELADCEPKGWTALRELRSILCRTSLPAEVDDTAARSMAAAAGLPFHRLVWGRYRPTRGAPAAS